MPLIEEAYERAINICKNNAKKHGFVASGSVKGYGYQVWARDSGIIIYGTAHLKNKILLEASKNSLITLAKNQTSSGLIPCNVRTNTGNADFQIEGGLDSNSWFVIAAGCYYAGTRDEKFLKFILPYVNKSIFFLKNQDVSNTGIIESQEGSDWMDASLHRRGKVFYQNVLYYEALKQVKYLNEENGDFFISNKDIELTKQRINDLFWPSKNGSHRFPICLRHDLFRERYVEMINKKRTSYVMDISFDRFVDYCDTLANSLAILFDLADKERSRKIISGFIERKISEPYPARTIDPVVLDNRVYKLDRDLKTLKKHGTKYLHWSNFPYFYHNSGIWPMVGGFYVSALSKVNKKLAKTELERLAELNKLGKYAEWEFNEWHFGYSPKLKIKPLTIKGVPIPKPGQPMGQTEQTWSAGMYAGAYHETI